MVFNLLYYWIFYLLQNFYLKVNDVRSVQNDVFVNF